MAIHKSVSTLKHEFSAAGVVLAVSAFGASLTPSLMPRDPLVQSVLAGVAASLAYELILLTRGLWRYMELPEIGGFVLKAWRIGGVLCAAVILIYSLSKAAGWQDATRLTVQLPPLETGAPFFIFIASLVITLFLWILFRLLGLARGIVSRQLERIVPRRVGVVFSIAFIGWLFWTLIDGALVRNLFAISDASFMAADLLLEPNIAQPHTPDLAGSPASLIKWDEMGRHGRAFTATAPTREEISNFTGQAAKVPVRVYVGRLSASTAEERANIAFEELVRLGGFERSALVIAAPVGTGWMDPHAHDTLDFMLGGDVATVGVQYSYLTSALSLMAHPEYGVEQSEALFDRIYEHWVTLPKEQRPKLYVFGLSQGAFNSQAVLNILDILADPIDGALWAGSPFFASYWSEVRDNRAPESPAWRPQYGNGSLIRVMDQYGGLDGPFSPWGPIRIVFLNYGSDPIVNFTFDSGIFRPAWLNQPRAPDVTDKLTWFPGVTMMQLALDSAFSLRVPRFGHYYVSTDYVDAWAAVLNPDGWTQERAETLKALLANRFASEFAAVE